MNHGAIPPEALILAAVAFAAVLTFINNEVHAWRKLNDKSKKR